MSAKSASVSDLIAVPKGGGALKGMGEKFSADLHTGTGNFSVPIALPPGRNGFQPQLTLGFSTGSGNGPFGLGWALSVPGVSRLTSKGIPRYRDSATPLEQDTFVLSGSEDLVEVGDAVTQPRSYRPRTEGLFARITRHFSSVAGSETDHWEVRTKDGLISTYGTPNQPATTDAPDTRAVIADPETRRKVFAWRLTETRDPFGNRIAYDYVRDLATDRGRNWDQLYLRRVRYVDLHDANQGEFLISAEILYDDDPDPPGITPEFPKTTRPDAFSDYRAGFEIRTRRRCKWIVVRTHPTQEPPGSPVPVRAYEFIYADELTSNTAALPLNGVSLLSRINVIGFDDDGVAHRELPPLDFDYSRFAPETRKFIALEGRDLPATSLANPDMELVDLFGHGLPDIVELGGSVRYWRNLGDGRFDMPRAFAEVPSSWKLSDAGVQLLDANGDGRADLVVTTGELAGYFPLDFRAEFSRKSFQRYQQSPTFNLEDPEVRLIDLTGDGVTDVLRSGTSFECYFNDPRDGWLTQNTTRVQRQQLDAFPNVSFSDPRVKLADLSGDGLQDIAVVYEGRVDYWPNLGYGRWGNRITMALGTRLPTDFDPQRVLLGDVDGDGLADLVYVSDRKVTLWMNRTGNGWSEPTTIQGTPAVNSMVTVRLSDILGSGVPGVLWSRDADASGRSQHFFLDFTGGRKPYLLDTMDNNLGAVTEVTYVSSSKFYVADAVNPQTRWRTTLPFPVQVVEKVAVKDALSDGTLTTEYRYHHGYWDGVEREFRGFGMVEQLDTEMFDGYAGRGLPADQDTLQRLLQQQSFSPPVLTRTWFHQGPLDPADDGHWTDNDWSAEYWPGDGNLLDHTQSINAFLATVPAGVQRDALRTLRGSVLRSELYALDGSASQESPYTVTEHAYGLREESAPDPASDRQHIFFPHAVAQRTTQWERGIDPLTQFSFMPSSAYDDVGQSTLQIAIACPRGWDASPDSTSQDYLATLSHTVYAQAGDPALYIRDRAARTRTFEIANSAPRTVVQLGALTEVSADLKLIGESLNFYDATDDAATGYGAFVGRAIGEVGGFGALVHTESLVIMTDHIKAAYGAAPPPYLVPGGAFAANADYPASFVPTLPALAGYVYRQGSASNSEGYFAVTTSRRFDFHSAAGTGIGLVLAQRDPLGHESTIEYDAFDLLPVSVRDPANLLTAATYNLRTLQPREVTDPNGNVTRLGYSPSGLVTDTWILGKPNADASDRRNAGDRVLPGVHVEYDLLAYLRSRTATPNEPQPVYACAVRRVFHDSDPDDTGETIETREYSDGFGRPLQTRTQGEEVRFGDATFGGGESVLPVKQSDGASGEVSGNANLPDFAAAVLADKPVAYFRLNEPPGTATAADWSGNGNNGTYPASGVALGAPGLGVGDTGAQFDGAGPGRIVVPDNAALNPSTITIEALVSWAGPNGFQQRILEKSFGAAWPTRTDYGLSILDDGRVHVEIATDSDFAANSITTMKQGVGTHLAATYDGSTIEIYINGVLDASVAAGGNIQSTQGSQIAIGNQAERDRAFKGTIDEVALYTKPLTADEVQVHVQRVGIGQNRLDNVMVSGWQRYDNKGQVVEKFEPFWSIGWDYAPPAGAQYGQKVTMFYDPRGQVIRTVNPDGSEQRVIHGIPNDIEDPPLTPDEIDKFKPTPWEAYTYDANDNAGRTPDADPNAASYRHHWNTPASIEVDALGRTVRAVARHRDAPPTTTSPLPPIEEHVTRSAYDIQGNIVSIHDALGRLAFEYAYDLTKRALRTESIDAGERRAVFDAAGNAIEGRDAKGAIALHAYDVINRPIRLWARDAADDAVTLRERIVYGDGDDVPGTVADKQLDNQLGKPYQYFDEAGVVATPSYDFKANALKSTRQVLSDDFLLTDIRAQTGPEWAPRAPRVDWEAAALPGLDLYVYETRSAFDALGRIKFSDYPVCANGEQYRLKPSFNRAGSLQSVALLGPLDQSGAGPSQTYVERIAYNAKGQRLLITYGNGLMTRYAYDARTFRLARMRTERYAENSPATYQSNGQLLQDLAYTYDLSGNIVTILDQTPGSGVANNPTAILADPGLRTLLTAGDALLRQFDYDPLYRLVSATGRECADIPQPRPWSDDARCGYNSGNHGTPNQTNAPNVTAFYREQYEYDAAGNMTALRHGDGGAPKWVRYFGMGGLTPQDWQQRIGDWKLGNDVDWGSDGNHLTNVGDGDASIGATHSYDSNGNMIGEQTERHFEWDHADRMKVFRNQVDTGKPSTYALHVYDASGQRVKKLAWTGSDYRTTAYLGSAFEHHREVGATATVENCSLHVMDDKSRIAIVRVGPAFDEDGAAEQPVQYQVADHLGSSCIVVSGARDWINREEFFPYGETSFGSFGKKKYRFTAKQRDEESGLNYHGARFYSPWLTIWISSDHLITNFSASLYTYAARSPIRFHDPDGKYEKDFHFGVIDYLLRSAGVDAKTADEIASYSQFVDDNPATEPVRISPKDMEFGGVIGEHDLEVRRFFHFPGSSPSEVVKRNDPSARARVVDSLRAFKDSRAGAGPSQTNAKMRLGANLHTFADTWSHEGFTGDVSKSLNTRTERLLDVARAGHADTAEEGHAPDKPYNDVDKAIESAKTIYELLSEAGLGRAAPWEKLEPELRSLFSSKESDQSKRQSAVLDLIERKTGQRPEYNLRSLDAYRPMFDRQMKDLQKGASR